MKFEVEVENTNSWVVFVYKLQGKYENTIVFYLLKYLICAVLRRCSTRTHINISAIVLNSQHKQFLLFLS